MDPILRRLLGSTAILRAPDKGDGDGGGGGGGGDQKGNGEDKDGAGDGDEKRASDGMVDFDAKDGGDDDGDKKKADADDKSDDKAPLLKLDDKPDWLSSNFFDADTGEVKLEALAKSQNDLRAKISKGDDKTPRTPDGYVFELDDTEKAIEKQALLDGSNDPILKRFKADAHKAGLNRDQAATMYKGFLSAAGDVLGDMPEPGAEKAKLGPKADRILHSVETWGRGLAERGQFSQDDLAELQGLCSTAAGVRLVMRIRESMGGQALPMTDMPAGDGVPSGRELWDKTGEMMKGNPTPAEVTAWEKQYENAYGTDPAGASKKGLPQDQV